MSKEKDEKAVAKRSMDKSKYVFVVETEGPLSGCQNDTRTDVVTKYEFATNDGDGDFVLYLDIDSFFEPANTATPFSYYFEDDEDHEDTRRSSYCEGIRHYALSPCPIRIYVQNQQTGKKAELFDFSFGRLWLHHSLEEYTADGTDILGVLIEAGPNKPTGHLISIFNKCANLKNSVRMKIALFQASGTTTLGVRILVEASSENVADFFESLEYK